MDRRAVLRLLALGSALPVLPPDLLAAARHLRASLPASPALRILSPHQDATVTAMAELLIPQTDTPGAKAVHVNEFIDLILAEWYSDDDRRLFLAGLDDVDARSRSLFSQTFIQLSSAQQAEIFRALGDELALAQAAVADNPRGYRGSAPEPDDNFYLMFRDLVLTGYFTSEPGFTLQLHEEIVPGHFDGCIPVTPPADKAH